LLFLLAAVLLALIISPIASPRPDGLEKVAGDKGFIEKADVKPTVRSPLRDYIMPGIKNEKVATAIAGALGTLLVFGIGYGLAAILGAKQRNKKGSNNAS